MLSRLPILLAVIFFFACQANSNAPDEIIASKIEVGEFAEKLKKLSNVQLVDVRTPEEVAGGTVPNAMNINYNGADFDKQLDQLNKEQPIMVFCQKGVPGGRSGQTMQKLKDMGFNEIYELAGGYAAWADLQLIAEVLDVPTFAKKLNELQNVQLIDVRTPEECAGGIIQNAVNHNFYESDFQNTMAQLNKDQPVMVYCKAGGRSGKTLKMLTELGFKEVYDLKGGYTAWSQQKQ